MYLDHHRLARGKKTCPKKNGWKKRRRGRSGGRGRTQKPSVTRGQILIAGKLRGVLGLGRERVRKTPKNRQANTCHQTVNKTEPPRPQVSPKKNEAIIAKTSKEQTFQKKKKIHTRGGKSFHNRLKTVQDLLKGGEMKPLLEKILLGWGGGKNQPPKPCGTPSKASIKGRGDYFSQESSQQKKKEKRRRTGRKMASKGKKEMFN